MKVDYHNFAELEHANYAAMQPMVEVTPGMELRMRPDVLLISNPSLPLPDVNHACLLRTTPDAAPALVDEIVEYFHAKEVTPTIYLSPACTPANLGDLLIERGFSPQKEQEAWLVLDGAQAARLAKPSSDVEMRAITKEEIEIFVNIFLQAFGMPLDYAPFMADAMRPSVQLPNLRHYVAFMKGKPAGVCTALIYHNLIILGSAGILPQYRGRKVLETMGCVLFAEWAPTQLDTALFQTTSGALFQRYLHFVGLKTVSTRTCYTLQ
ncbi:MAG: hypothetical protein JXA21_15605 [Anaerolineae bacterium]|nr:hypothetical protein [Anaerolineae bacterium]